MYFRGVIPAKYIIFLTAFFTVVPTCIYLFKKNDFFRDIGIWMMIFFTPFVFLGTLEFLQDETYYRGTTRSLQVNFLDFILLALFVVMIGDKRYKFQFWTKGLVLYLIYFFLSFLSSFKSPQFIYSAFELIRMLKMWMYFLVCYNIFLNYRRYNLFLSAIGTAIVVNFVVSLYQKYGLGYYNTFGFLPHKNSAAMFVNMIAPIFLAYILNRSDVSRKIFYFNFVIYGACGMMVVFSLSRGGLFFFLVGVLVTVLLSFIGKFSFHKIKIVLLLGILGLMGFAKAYNTIEEKYSIGNPEGTEGRKHFAASAIDMANKNFLGTGLNNYTLTNTADNNYGGYFDVENRPEDYQSGIVETIYLLTAAESGWITLAAMLMWYGYYGVIAFINAIRYRLSTMFYMPVGIFGALFSSYGMSTLEWIFRQTIGFYQVMILYAILDAMNTTYKRIMKSGR